MGVDKASIEGIGSLTQRRKLCLIELNFVEMEGYYVQKNG